VEWKEYYGKLWNEKGCKGEEESKEESRSKGIGGNVDMITTEELKEVLKQAKKKQEKLWTR